MVVEIQRWSRGPFVRSVAKLQVSRNQILIFDGLAVIRSSGDFGSGDSQGSYASWSTDYSSREIRTLLNPSVLPVRIPNLRLFTITMGGYISSLSSLARNSPSPEPTGPSPLLDLPLELRTMIYEYALYYEDGLSMVPLTRRSTSAITLRPSNTADGRITNPLKLICRQVRAETQKLPLKLNIVHVDDHTQRLMYNQEMWHFVRGLDYGVYRHGPIRRLFVQVPYDRELDRMLTVMIYWPGKNRFQLSLNAWVAYSRSHPLCEIQWAFDLRSCEAYRPGLVLMWMVALEIVITGGSLITLSDREKAFWIPNTRNLFAGCLDKHTGAVALPTNFRIYIDAPFAEDMVLARLRQQGETSSLTDLQVQDMVEQVKIVHEQGIRGRETTAMREAKDQRLFGREV